MAAGYESLDTSKCPWHNDALYLETTGCVLFLDIHHWVADGQDLTCSSLHLLQHSCRFVAWHRCILVVVVLLSVCQVQSELTIVCRS